MDESWMIQFSDKICQFSVIINCRMVEKMEFQFDLNKEIKKIDDRLLDKEQISTIDVALYIIYVINI